MKSFFKYVKNERNIELYDAIYYLVIFESINIIEQFHYSHLMILFIAVSAFYCNKLPINQYMKVMVFAITYTLLLQII